MTETTDKTIQAPEYAETERVDGRTVFTVPAERLHDAARYLRDVAGCDFLIDIVGMDWGDSLGAFYHMSPTDRPAEVITLKTATADRETPHLESVCDIWEVAQTYEREVHDFFGIVFTGNPDMRRLFLRESWQGYPLRKDYDADPALNPLHKESEPLSDMDVVPYFTLEDGRLVGHMRQMYEEDEYIVNFGPQHPAMHGVLHLRVSLDGEVIRSVDPNLGYIHRGIEKMCESYAYPQILHLTERLDYLSGNINRHAFCLCCEKALQIEAPQRAVYVRTIMDELTRIASHLLGWGSMCMDMGSITAFVYGMRDREKIMDIFEDTAGGRLMTSYYTIGGLASDIHPDFCRKVKEFIPYMRKMLREHHMLFTGNPIAAGRMKKTGRLTLDDAISLGATGPSGRASGWSNDIRKIAPYAAYDKVDFEVPMRTGGDTFDRYMVRLDEIEQSLRIIEQLIDNIPEGPYAEKMRPIIKLPEGEYFQRVENARGQFGVHISSRGDKTPYRVKFRSPCLPLVGALKHITPGSKVADLIMIGGSLDYVIPCMDR